MQGGFCLTLFLLMVSSTFCDIQREMQVKFNRPDLDCPYYCNFKGSVLFNLQCCVCQSFSNIHAALLSLEFVNSTKPLIGEPTEWSKFYQLIYQSGNLIEVPLNICDYNQSMFRIDLSYNRIKTFPNIDCLFKLDTLLLQGNLIEIVDSDIIRSLQYLRFLDLSYNKIQTLGPEITVNFNGNLFFILMNHNKLNSLDITNMVMAKQHAFCSFDYSYNNIERLENENNWTCPASLKSGGIVDLSSNLMVDFFDNKYLSYLGFKSVSELGKLINYGINIRNNKWLCDCKMYEMAKLAEEFIMFIDRDYFHFKCYSPQELHGNEVIDIITSRRLHLLICNITMKNKCPPRCHCFYQPHNDRTVVDCSKRHFRKLPSALPDDNKLEVDFSENNLTTINPNMNFTERIKLLNLSQNNILEISDHTLFMLRNAQIDLRGNKLIRVSQAFQMMSKCDIFIDTVIQCKCSDAWMIDWLVNSTSSCANNIKVYCNINGQKRLIQFLNKMNLGCKTTRDNKSIHQLVNWLVIALVSLLVATSISVSFRYELFILARSTLNFIIPKKPNECFPIDCYIACNTEDPSIRSYMFNTLLPFFQSHKYRPFLSCLHGDLGRPREEEISDIMSKSKGYVLFLSAHYEWKYAWHYYARDRSRKLIIVNYDMVTAKDVSPKYIKAFLNLGWDIDFANRKKLLEKQIVSDIPISSSISSDDHQIISRHSVSDEQDENIHISSLNKTSNGRVDVVHIDLSETINMTGFEKYDDVTPLLS